MASNIEDLDEQINSRFNTQGAEDADYVDEGFSQSQSESARDEFKEPSEAMLAGSGVGLDLIDFGLSKVGIKTFSEDEKDELTHCTANILAQIMPKSTKILNPKEAALWSLGGAVLGIVKNRMLNAQKENMRDVTPQQPEQSAPAGETPQSGSYFDHG